MEGQGGRVVVGEMCGVAQRMEWNGAFLVEWSQGHSRRNLCAEQRTVWLGAGDQTNISKSVHVSLELDMYHALRCEHEC